MHQIRPADLPWEERRSPTGRYHSYFKNISLALGGVRDIGPWGGGHPFDLQLRRVPPGAAVCPQHAHAVQWELFVVLAGTATVRAGTETHSVAAGDAFMQPPGAAHQIINSGGTDLEFYVIANNSPADSTWYPNSRKWMLKPQGNVFRMAEVDYYDGEEEGQPALAASSAPATAVASSGMRRVRIADLPWEERRSPGGKFGCRYQAISLALGGVRDGWPRTGHPFDLVLVRLPPGRAVCPYHSHAAQWEMFMLVSGAGIVRTAGGRQAVTAGDVVLHPPGEAHQILNSGPEDFVFYILADNPPVDVCHYPDSNKWAFVPSRKVFRLTETDYFEGEE
ncbi:MAG TPA: cupin domain-containing protein [Opitutaceae bacterium]|nr:cupin domain-containing protein [Opitutaceae bacterium]